ncbi:MAG: carbon-nitrogen hydrolase [Acidobacteriota bacterium]
MTHHNSPERFKVGLIQMSCAPQVERNLEKAIRFLHEAAENGAQIVCLQELFRSQYFCQSADAKLFDLAEPIPGPTTETLASVARERRIVIVASLFERRDAGVYHNTSLVLDADGQLLGTYRKMHIPDDPLYYEKFYFTPGDQGYRVFDTCYGRIGVLVCWDQWYPEAARITALQGAKVLFYPTAIGWHPSEKEQYGTAHFNAWKTIQRAHAIANGVYVAAVNRVGHEILTGEGLQFWGGSFLCDPFGVMLKEASHEREEVLIGECDLGLLENIRRNWPFLRDRRIDSYQPILSRLIDNSSH